MNHSDVRRSVWNLLGKIGAARQARQLKGCRYALWKNPEDLTHRQRTKLAWIARRRRRASEGDQRADGSHGDRVTMNVCRHLFEGKQRELTSDLDDLLGRTLADADVEPEPVVETNDPASDEEAQ